MKLILDQLMKAAKRSRSRIEHHNAGRIEIVARVPMVGPIGTGARTPTSGPDVMRNRRPKKMLFESDSLPIS